MLTTCAASTAALFPECVPAYPPSPALRARVRAIHITYGSQAALTVLPTTSAVLGFQFRGRVRAEQDLLAPAGVTGLQSTARRYEYLEGTNSVLVHFTPQGVRCLGVPASVLLNANLALEDLLPAAQVREVLERVTEAETNAERIGVVEQFLLQLPFTYDPVVARALQQLSRTDQVPAISGLARSLSLSERQLERRFLAQIGVSPKRFAGLLRFERAVHFASSSATLTEAAIAAGYYDHSHFDRDFRRFAGTPPSEFFRRQSWDVGNIQATVGRGSLVSSS